MEWAARVSGGRNVHPEREVLSEMWSMRLAVMTLCALLATVLFAPSARAALTLQITPATQTVAPGAEFEVKLRVIGASSPFNGFKAIVAYDPARLTAVQLSPLSSQVDSLIRPACTSLFHRFRLGSGLDSIDVAALCNGFSTSGPGPIYRLRFRAANTLGVTALQFMPGVEFADGGVLLSGVTASAAFIGIGTPVLEAGADDRAGRLSLIASPNPAAGETRLDFGRALDQAGQLRVQDIQGRVLLRREVAAGVRAMQWDGRDAHGSVVPPGLYLASLRCGARVRFTRLARVR